MLSVTATDDRTVATLITMSAEVISGFNVLINERITFGDSNTSGVRTMTINPLRAGRWNAGSGADVRCMGPSARSSSGSCMSRADLACRTLPI